MFWIKIKMKREDFKISKYTKGKEAEGLKFTLLN